jgi:prevent-host-death family protein
MKTAKATAVKNQFGQFLEMALTQPVAISKTGRRVAVMLAWREYERLAALEDAWWAKQAVEAERKGYLGAKGSAEFLRSKLNEKT